MKTREQIITDLSRFICDPAVSEIADYITQSNQEAAIEALEGFHKMSKQHCEYDDTPDYFVDYEDITRRLAELKGVENARD